MTGTDHAQPPNAYYTPELYLQWPFPFSKFFSYVFI